MNCDGSVESSEGVLNSSNIPFTTLLNIPLGIGNIPINNANSSMLTTPPASDITPRNGNNSFNTTPTSISSSQIDSERAHQNTTFANTTEILQSPECYGIINSLIRRHQLETPPTPTVQPASGSVLSLWPNGICEDYLGFINVFKQHQQALSPSISHSNIGSSVRSLWPSGISEDDGLCNRSVSQTQSQSFGPQEQYTSPSSLTNIHSPLITHITSLPSSRENCHTTSLTSSSSKSQSRRNAHMTPISSISSCSSKSPNRGITHTISSASFSHKSPGIENTVTSSVSSLSSKCENQRVASTIPVQSFSSKSPNETLSFTTTTLSCALQSFNEEILKYSLENPSVINSNIPNTSCSPCSLSKPKTTLSSDMCIMTSTGLVSGKDEVSSLDLNTGRTNEILLEKHVLPSTSAALSLSKINEVTESENILSSSESTEVTSISNSNGITVPLSIPNIHNVYQEIPPGLTSQPLRYTIKSATSGISACPANNAASFCSEETIRGDTTSKKRKISAEIRPTSSLLACPEVISITKQYPGEASTHDEEKIDVWSVKDSLLLKIVEPHIMAKDVPEPESEFKDCDDVEPGSPQLLSHLGSHCSRSVPSLMKFYSRHKRSLSSSLSINLAISGQATPPCSPISPGTHYANAVQFPNSGAFPILSPSSIIHHSNITNLSSPSSNSQNLQHSNQISPCEALHVTIPANSNALIPFSKQSISNTSIVSTSLSTSLNVLSSENTKKLSLEASTMTSPTEKQTVGLPTSSTFRGLEFNTGTRHCCATTTTTQDNDTNQARPSPITALTLLTVPTVVPNSLYSPITAASHAKLSSPSIPIKPGKKSKGEENDQSAFTHVNLNVPLNHSSSLSVPTTTTATIGAIPPGMPYSSPWSISHNPLAHPGSYWLPPPTQFSGVNAGVGAASLGLGYHVARDQLTGHLYLLPRPHPLSDPSGHGLMWTGYGSMAAPPVVMTPQQLLLGDPHYRHAIHSSLMHMHHSPQSVLSSPSKKVESPSMMLKDEDKKSHSPIGSAKSPSAPELALPQQIAAPHFLFPPSTVPYYYSQPPPTHPSHYSLSGYSHGSNPTLGMPANLIQALTTTPFTTSTPTLTTAAAVLAPLTITTTLSNVKISSSASASVWSRGSDISISSPGLYYEPLMARNSDIYADPPMDLTQKRKSPHNLKLDSEAKLYDVGKSKSKIGVAAPKLTKPVVIKKEIKEEVLSPPLTVNSEEESISESKTKHDIKLEPGRTFTDIENYSVSSSDNAHFNATRPQNSLDHVLDLTRNEKQSSDKTDCRDTASLKNEIDSSGLELLFHTMFQHEDRLAPSPLQDIDSNSSHSEQMPHLERAAKTPSPRCSPCSYESLPPVLTPFAPTPTIPVESDPGSPDHEQTSPPVNSNPFDKLRPGNSEILQSQMQPKSNCFSFLCALAEQRILEEQHNSCSALSSLADVALSTPSVLTDLPLCEIESVIDISTGENLDELLVTENVNLNDQLEASTSFSESVTSLDMHFQGKDKTTDINRNYKSPESEREVKAFIANKVSQYHKEFINDSNLLLPNYQIQMDEMDPAEIDMRMQLAAIQRKYKEKQHELSKLLPKKDSFSPSKRGRGRPPKPKLNSLSSSIKRKVGRPQKKLPETLSDSKENEENCFKLDNDGNICSSVELKPFSQNIVPLQINQSESLNHSKLEESSEEESYSASDSIDPLFKPPSLQLTEIRHEDSDDDIRSETSSSKRDHIHLHTETSVESSTSDAEIHMSSSKKRKPGRPKKHSPTKYDATETIVAKKSKSLGFLLLQKSKIRPKLKAELKIRDSDEDDDEDNDFNHYSSKRIDTSDENQEELSSKPLKPNSMCHSKGNIPMHKKLTLSIQHHGAPQGRTSLSRNTILRDKEKRKSTFEKNSQMQQLFRSLKRHSKVADPEHDESGDEREDNSEEEDLHKKECLSNVSTLEPNTKDMGQCSLPNSTPNSFKAINEETNEPIEVKQEENICDASQGENPSRSFPFLEKIKLEENIKADVMEGEITGTSPEKEKDISICSLQVEDLVKGARVLVLQDGLLYAGNLMPITPPDVYGVHIDGERGTRPHICCQEELLTQSWKEVKPGSTRFLTEGTRVCAFWSQQYRGLYPGCVAAASSPSHEGNHNLVNVEFDDGDSGRIHVDDIRLLPEDFPVIEYDPNPLVTMNKRKRRPTEEDNSDIKASEGANKKLNKDSAPETSKTKNKNRHKKKETSNIPSEIDHEDNNALNYNAIIVKTENEVILPPNQSKAGYIGTTPLSESNINHVDDENILCSKKVGVQKWTTDNFLLDSKYNYTKPIKRRRALSLSSGKKHKKRHHSETHKHKRKHKRRRRTLEDNWLHPHIEQGDNELKMRIRSPPPHQEDSVPTPFECNESSASDDEEIAKEIEKKILKKPQRRVKRSPSEKSKIAPFLPEQQLWKWSGKGYKRPGGKGKGKKEFYKEIVRGEECIKVGDCAVFLSSGSPDRPFIGKIDFLWEGWGGNMVVKVRWFYHPDETKEAERKLTDPRDALFSSFHTDENDVQTISHKCDVIPLADYKLKRAELDQQKATNSENNDDLYYLAGFYDTTHGRITMEPGVS